MLRKVIVHGVLVAKILLVGTLTVAWGIAI